MSITITITIDDATAARLRPMVEKAVHEMRRHPLVEARIANLPGVVSADDLTIKQKAKLLIMFHLLKDLAKYEAQNAAEAANTAAAADVVAHFPIDVGEP